MAARAYGVIGLRARAAKIKQVCSVTTRGGEREREREGKRGRDTEEREGRETEGGRGPTAELLSGPKQLVENFPRSRCVLPKTAGNGEGRKTRKKKKHTEGERVCRRRETGRGSEERKEETRKEKKRRRQRVGV